MLAQMQNAASNMAPPRENTTDATWTLVKKSKKRQNKDRSADVDMETDGAQSKLGSNPFDGSVVAVDGDTDYVIKNKSKKKKKEQRARDDGLAESLDSLTTDAVTAPATVDGDSHQEKHREKKKKRKLEANDESTPTHTIEGEDEGGAPAESKRKKTSRKEQMREAIKMAEERNGVEESDDGLEMNKFKKKKKKRKTAADTEDFSSGDEANRRVRECNAIEQATQKPVTAQKVLKEQRKLAKIARKMERSLNC